MRKPTWVFFSDLFSLVYVVGDRSWVCEIFGELYWTFSRLSAAGQRTITALNLSLRLQVVSYACGWLYRLRVAYFTSSFFAPYHTVLTWGSSMCLCWSSKKFIRVCKWKQKYWIGCTDAFKRLVFNKYILLIERTIISWNPVKYF